LSRRKCAPKHHDAFPTQKDGLAQIGLTTGLVKESLRPVILCIRLRIILSVSVYDAVFDEDNGGKQGKPTDYSGKWLGHLSGELCMKIIPSDWFSSYLRIYLMENGPV
jgi:hypothetical protein